MKQVNWGIIGTGDVTEVKSGPGLYKALNSNVVAVYNRTFDKAKDYARRHKINKVYASAKDLIMADDIDAVYIATPPNSHMDYAIQVLKAGKIPYIEKPLALNNEEASEIKKWSDRVNIPVYVSFYRRGLEKFIMIKNLLDEGRIGDIRYVRIIQTDIVGEEYKDSDHLPWRVIPAISGGGLFMDIGSHVLDCLMMFFGDFEEMNGYAANNAGFYPAEDTVMATFRFSNGITGTGTWCFAANKTENMVEIVGSKGRIIYDGLSAKNFTMIVENEESVFEFEAPNHIAMPYQVSVINEILGLEKSNANFEQSVNLSKMMDGILMDYYK